MSDEFAELLKQKLSECTDVTRLVDCVWNDNRCRTLLIRKIQSTPEAGSPDTSVPTSSVSLHAAMPGAEVPDKRDVSVGTDFCSQSDTDSPCAHVNSPMFIRSDAAITDEPSLGDAALDIRCQTPDENASPSYPSPSPTPGPPRRHRSPEIEDSSASYDIPSRKRRRVNKKESEKIMGSSAEVSHSYSSSSPRKFRGPGKKKKAIVPYFEEPKFLNVKEPLRLQVSEYTELNGIQDALRLVEAFECQTVEGVQPEPSASLVRKLKCRLDECDKLEERGHSLAVRAQVERYFNMIQVIAELFRRKKEKAEGETDDDIVREFKKELFPEQTPQQAQSSWDYFYRVGKVLFEAVQRYGYGVLVFPLYGVTKKSLHELGHKYIGDFLDYIGRCQPALEARIRNISYILPRLMTWGLPAGTLQVEKVQFEELSEPDRANAFNCCFPLPAGVSSAELQVPNIGVGIPSWPEQPSAQDVVQEESKDDEQDGETSQLSWGGMPLEDVGIYGFDRNPDC